jgi:hypothetical protein
MRVWVIVYQRHLELLSFQLFSHNLRFSTSLRQGVRINPRLARTIATRLAYSSVF